MTATHAHPDLAIGLRTVAINGSYTASRALSKWLRRGVRLTSDGFRCVPISEVSSAIGVSDDVIVAIHVPMKGDVSGHMLMTFPEKVALSLVDMVMQVPEGTSSAFDELEQSCLQETGNIVCSAYTNSLSKWLKLRIEPDVPTFGHDMVSSIIDPLLMDLAAYHDELFMAMTDFLLDSQRLEWGMLLIPSHASLQAMESRCQLDAVREHALHTIAINGAFNASRSVSKWLKRGVKISTDGFTRVPLADVASRFDELTPIAALHMPLGKQLHGHALLAIPLAHALRLVDLLFDQPPGTATELGEMERSALEETGNIIVGSFMNSWSTWLDMPIEPGVPRFVLDLPAAVLDIVLAEQAVVNDDVFMAQTDFVVDDQWLEWMFLLLPAPSGMRLIETSCL